MHKKYTLYTLSIEGQTEYAMTRTPLMRISDSWIGFDKSIGEFTSYHELLQLLCNNCNMPVKKAKHVAKQIYDEYYW